MSSVELKPVGKRGRSIPLPVGKTTVGRGPFLGCTDKRISRNHAVLEVTSDGKVTLTPINVNPCFKVGDDAEFKPLLKDVALSLNHGDCFAMLPSSYQYEVIITRPKSSRKDKNADTKNLNAAKKQTARAKLDEQELQELPTPAVPKKDKVTGDATTTSRTKLNKVEVAERKASALLVSDDGPSTSSASANRKRALPAWLIDAAEQQGKAKQKTPPKRTPAAKPKASNKQARDGDRNEVKQPSASKANKGQTLTPTAPEKPAKSPNISNKGRNTTQVNYGRLNNDISEDSDEDVPSTNKAKPNVKVPVRKQNYEMSGEDSDAESASNVAKAPKGIAKEKRTPCTFGVKCYRKNPQHFKDFSHPGDDDYNSDPGSGGDSDDSNDSRPECEFGLSCYRKNPQHRKDYKHTTQKPPQRAAAKKAKAKVRSRNDDSDDEDDDSNDSFIDDDSDDYKPDSGEDSDEDPSVLFAEAEKFKRNKKLLKPV